MPDPPLSERKNTRLCLIAGFLVSIFLCLYTYPAAAQIIPPSISPGQVEKRFEQPPPRPREAPPIRLPTPGKPELPQETWEALAQQRFILKSARIEGATLYPPEELQSLYADKVGQEISLLDATNIAQQITDRYHQDGYALSQAVVPAQEVSEGRLKIQVVEGFISQVLLEGDIKTESERALLESYAEGITRPRPVRTQDIEHYLLLMDDLPGLTVSGLLRPSPDQFGAAELVITATHKAFEGYYVFDNRGSKYIGPWQHTAALSAHSMFGVYDHSQMRLYSTSPHSEQLIGLELLHREQLGRQGTQLALLASHVKTQPGDTLGVLDIHGTSDIFEATVTHPFIRSRQENLTARFIFDYHNTITNVFRDISFTNDRLRVLRFGGNYNKSDTWQGNNMIDLQLSQGLDIFGASESGFERSNPIGDSSFTKINMDVSRLQALRDRFSLLLAASGQYSFAPLLVDEQFSLGGPDYARAFDPAELTGDHGLAGKIEVRYDYPVAENWLSHLQLYGFFDIGQVWRRDLPPEFNTDTTLSSTGGGMRMEFTENLYGSFEAAVPLIKPAVDQTSYRHDPRLFMSLMARF